MFIKLNHAEIEDASEKLDFIYSHYRDLCGDKEGVDVFVNSCVASEISSHCESRNWSQRYFVSLKNKKYPPGRLAYGAIIKKYDQILANSQLPSRAEQNLEYTRSRNDALKDYAIEKGYSSWSEIGTMILAGRDLVKEKEQGDE